MNLVARVKGILLNPKQEWQVIDTEPPNTNELLTRYILPLAAIGPIAAFIGMSVFGVGGIFRVPVGAALTAAITSYIFTVLGVFVAAWVVNALAPSFGAQQSMPQAIKLIAYSSTAVWIAGILGIIPALALLGIIAGLYSLYLLYLGIPVLMKASPEKAMPYTVVAIVTIVLLYIVIGALTSAIAY